MQQAENSQQLSYRRLRSGIFWLIAVRLAVLALSMLAATISWFFGAIDETLKLFLPLGAMFGFSAVSAAAAIRWRTGTLFVLCQLLADLILTTAIIYLTGCSVSPFLFLYLPLVMVARIMFSREVALLTAIAGVTIYSILLILVGMDVVALPYSSPQLSLSISESILQIVGLAGAMLLVAYLTGFLTSLLTSSRLLIEESRKSISELSQRQRAFIEHLPSGMITLDLDNSVTSANKTALDLLKCDEKSLEGKNVFDFLSKLSEGANIDVKQLDTQAGFEVILPNGGIEPRRVICTMRAFRSAEGEISGHMLFLQDVTQLRTAEERLELHDRMARLFADSKMPEKAVGTPLERFVGESAIMQKVFRLIERVSASDATVLINGESGTGKELVARAIHAGSDRASGNFVPVNCGAIPETLIESELFGHKKGSFTGAEFDATGLFRQANNGTIFLDEIGELPLHMQTKLLRTLQERTVRPVGGDKDIPVDVRIVAATNKNLKEEVRAGRFRSDLYYRINVISINLPPLRERKEDIPLLVRCFLDSLVDSDNRPLVPPGTMKYLQDYDYPGNVRELENILERALVLGGEVILPEHLPENVLSISESLSNSCTEIIVDDSLDLPIRLDDYLAGIEMRYLQAALDLTNGKKKDAAALLGINFRSFRYRLQKFNLDIQ